jgi:hypothetical protein
LAQPLSPVIDTHDKSPVANPRAKLGHRAIGATERSASLPLISRQSIQPVKAAAPKTLDTKLFKRAIPSYFGGDPVAAVYRVAIRPGP